MNNKQHIAKPPLSTKSISLCGVMSAISALCMICGGFIPIATFAAPALAGLMLVPAAIELGEKCGYLIFSVVSVLSFIMVADKEMAFVFIFFFGYYPILKSKLDSIKSSILQKTVKLAIFNLAVILIYSLLLFVFKSESLISEFGNTNIWFFAILIFLANIMFYIYDQAISKLVWIYQKKYRSRIEKSRVK